MPAFEAFIFDMNGTMINDMHYHEMAWYNVLVHQLKAPLTVEQVKNQLYGTAPEMFERVFGKGKFSPPEIERISWEKESRYRAEYLPHLQLINGLQSFLDRARTQNIPMAIGTAAPKENVDFVLDNLNLRSYFPVITGPEDVEKSKPNPDVFLQAAGRLGISPEHCIVFEDAPKGIEAARRAGMKAIAITTFHTTLELANQNVLFTIEDFTHPALEQLF